MNGLEKEYEGQLTCEIKDATDDAGKAAVKALGFKNHGLVIYDAKTENLLSKIDGHIISEEEIRKAVTSAL